MGITVSSNVTGQPPIDGHIDSIHEILGDELDWVLTLVFIKGPLGSRSESKTGRYVWAICRGKAINNSRENFDWISTSWCQQCWSTGEWPFAALWWQGMLVLGFWQSCHLRILSSPKACFGITANKQSFSACSFVSTLSSRYCEDFKMLQSCTHLARAQRQIQRWSWICLDFYRCAAKRDMPRLDRPPPETGADVGFPVSGNRSWDARPDSSLPGARLLRHCLRAASSGAQNRYALSCLIKLPGKHLDRQLVAPKAKFKQVQTCSDDWTAHTRLRLRATCCSKGTTSRLSTFCGCRREGPRGRILPGTGPKSLGWICLAPSSYEQDFFCEPQVWLYTICIVDAAVGCLANVCCCCLIPA